MHDHQAQNITNIGRSGNLKGSAPHYYFVALDSNDAHFPPLAILQNVVNHANATLKNDNTWRYNFL